jgi:ElaB/YqjD/DUF883 family membrane-anchored ribosome-binding protein
MMHGPRSGSVAVEERYVRQGTYLRSLPKTNIMMNLNQTSKSLRAEVSGAAEEALQAGSHALETTRRLASQAMHKSATTVSDATAAAQRQLGHYAHATRLYVSEQPVKSALIAAAIGAAVAALVLVVRRNRP